MSDFLYLGFKEPLKGITLSSDGMMVFDGDSWVEIAQRYDEAAMKHRLEQLKKEEQELLRMMAETDLRVQPKHLTIEFSREDL